MAVLSTRSDFFFLTDELRLLFQDGAGKFPAVEPSISLHGPSVKAQSSFGSFTNTPIFSSAFPTPSKTKHLLTEASNCDRNYSHVNGTDGVKNAI